MLRSSVAVAAVSTSAGPWQSAAYRSRVAMGLSGDIPRVEESMQDHSVWVHGNSVRIENPENIVSSTTYGWGLDVTFHKRETTKVPDSWFHASVPSQLFGVLEDTSLVSVEILF